MSTANIKSKDVRSQSESEENACAVCFKHVDIYSIGVCDHPICFECSTRMRVLCKQMECPICRQDLVKVIFVKAVKPFHHITFNNYWMDKSVKIYFENPTIQEAYNKLLVHTCGVCPSKPGFSNLQSLKDHLRKEHEMFLCDLCVDNLKIFTWERKAYTRTELATHRRKGDPDNTSHRGHPLCNFCDQRYVDGDELFRHLRRDHYFCHFCDADGLNQYYCAYEDLREHFRDAHFLCEEGDCKEEKFTRVYRTDIDFRAHRAQTHTQSLGKAAAKQARTLELEFTLAPRPAANENKNRAQQGRRGGGGGGGAGPRNNREEPVIPPAPSVSEPQFIGASAADIKNPLEFPSLSSDQQASSSTQERGARTNGGGGGSDSLAQKLAKGSRFTVRGNGSAENEEFPSLVPGSREVPDGARGAKHSVHVRVSKNKTDEERTHGPNVSIQLTQKYPPSVSQGAGPPPTQPVARVTRVSSSQNIHVQPSRGLRLEEDFPSLVAPPSSSSSSGALKTGTGWAPKKEAAAPKPVATAAKPKKVAPSSVEDFPNLVPSSSKTIVDNASWNATKAKPNPVVNGNSTKVPPKVMNGSVPSSARTVESWTEPNKGGNKKKKKNAATGGIADDDVTTFTSQAERKISEMQIGELKKLSTHMGGTTLDLSSVAGTAEKKSMGSKIGLIKQPVVETGGVKPKAKPVPLKPSDFPALGGSTIAPDAPLLFQKKSSAKKPSPPPGFNNNNNDNNNSSSSSVVTPTKVTFTSSSGQNFPLSVDPILSGGSLGRVFTQPPDFALRNQQLISTVMDLLCHQQGKINQFRTVSNQFRSEQIDPSEYYHECVDIMGEDCFLALFPELVCLLPDIDKQQQLLKVHRSEMRMKGGSAGSSAEPYVICATCSQVLSPSDLKHHIASHSLETNFPVLGPPVDTNSTWSKR